MGELLALIAYGLLLNGGLFMTIFWGRIYMRRAKQLNRKDWIYDTYMVIAGALTVQSIGTGLLFGSRAASALVDGVSTIARNTFLSYMILLGLFTIVASKAAFVWAIHLDRKSRVWRAFMGLSVLWVLLATYWAVVDPFDSFDNETTIFIGGE